MEDKTILEEFYETLKEDERTLLTDYIKSPNFQILCDAFEKVILQSDGSQTKNNQD